MGGPIAKLCWSRHPEGVRGLVLCATAKHFTPERCPVLTRAVLPGAVVVMTRDKIVPTRRQYALAPAIPGVKQFEVDGNHFACANTKTNFVPELRAACDHVYAAAA